MHPRDKLTEQVAGEPLLRRSARRALATGLPVIALLPPDAAARASALDGLDLRRVEVAGARHGMSHSIRAGLAALPDDAAGAVMLMADMPDLTSDDLCRLVRRFEALGGDTVVRAAAEDGTPGAPAVIPRRLFPRLATLEGDSGGREVLRAEPQDLVRLPGNRALTDLDTPEAWAAWRATQG